MCGFFFYYSKTKKRLSKEEISNLKKIQHARGPDYSGYINYKNCHFFHNRLKIIDLKNVSNQPMISSKSGNLIIFNGEIYNFQELKDKFLKNYSFYSKSDTEVILYLYEELGADFINHLNGIFSFIIFDAKKNSVYLARDRFGVKPLNIYNDNKSLIISSEIKPILYIKNDISINQNLIKDYLINGYVHHSSKTLFKKVFLLDQASYKIFNLNYFKFVKNKIYWKLKKDKSLMVKTSEEFKENYQYQFKRSLDLNFTSDVDISMLISSGFDSRYMYKTLEKYYDSNIKTFTFGWGDKKYDESNFVEKNIIKNNKNHKTYKVKLDNFIDNLNNMIHLSESPIGGLGTYGVFKITEFIKKQNIKVILSGEGSDELNFGYVNMHASFINELKDKSKQKKELNYFNELYNETLSLKELKDKYLKSNLLTPDGMPMSLKSNKKDLTSEQIQKNYVHKFKLPKLLHFQDRAGGGYGIESRYPFLDHELVNFCFSNNNEYKISNGITKNHIRLEEDNRLSKKFVASPQREFLKDNYKNIFKYIKGGHLEELELIDIKKFQKDYFNYSKRKELGNSFFVWKVLNMELFLNKFL
tara:strand:+ start:1659 stop:3413 length:1755 start_codon:yes stop_codon:yes gene_type:complete